MRNSGSSSNASGPVAGRIDMFDDLVQRYQRVIDWWALGADSCP